MLNSVGAFSLLLPIKANREAEISQTADPLMYFTMSLIKEPAWICIFPYIRYSLLRTKFLHMITQFELQGNQKEEEFYLYYISPPQ